MNNLYGVNHITLRQQITKVLRQKILRGELLPGDKIVESEISTQLKISRGPVREAIRQLEEESLLTYLPNKGCSVTILNPTDAWEIYILRSDLEVLALKLSDGKFSEATIGKMEDIIKAMEKAANEGDIAEIVELDNKFHSEICMSPNKRRLFKLWSSLNGTSFAIFLTVTSAKVKTLKEMPSVHTEVLEAIKKGDLRIMCEVLERHYLSTGRKLLDIQKNNI